MTLIRNSLVFLDTGFFKHYRTTDTAFKDLLQYSKDGKIFTCTSYMCLREWRSQKVKQLVDLISDSQQKYTYTRRENIIADEILSRFPGNYPELEEIEKVSIEVIKQFVDDCKIRIYSPTEEHIERTFEAYFNGSAPFRERKSTKDIPDSWVFEAAKDARFDKENARLKHRFCLGTDNGLKGHLEILGLSPIEKKQLLEDLQREESQSVSGVLEPQNETINYSNAVNISNALPRVDTLEGILNSAISAEVKEIYIRLLGYTHWLSSPLKQDLFSAIESKGFSRKLIEASADILSQASLKLLEDTGNHFLPQNQAVCEEAANLIMSEILESLD